MANLMRFAVMLAATTLAACGPKTPYEPHSQSDQCIRAELFRQCMQSLPAGPVATQYNDWAEVVDECDGASYYQSMRPTQHIAPQCRTYSADGAEGRSDD